MQASDGFYCLFLYHTVTVVYFCNKTFSMNPWQLESLVEENKLKHVPHYP